MVIKGLIGQENSTLGTPDNPWNKIYANEVVGMNGNPVGTIIFYSMSTPPNGYLVCDGAEVSKTDYLNLFNVIGNTYGEPEDNNKFKLPNLIDKFAMGGMDNIGEEKEAGLPNITGRIKRLSTADLGLTNGGSDAYEKDTGSLTMSFKSYSKAYSASNSSASRLSGIGIDASLSNEVYGKSDTVQPPSVVLLPCIKY